MTSFADIGIQGEVLKGLASLGFASPTPVQEEVIPLLLTKNIDMVSLAQTGTGKTAAFGLPLIQQAEKAKKLPQALILCPTRELCVQVARDMTAFAAFVSGIRIQAVYGGASIEQQIKVLRRGVQIVVATPGRLLDLLRRGEIELSHIRTVVLDEADEMLQMGFQDELNAILSETPAEKNTLLFSATMSREVAAIAGNYMTDPLEITIGRRNAGAENVRHEYYMVRARDRYPALRRLVDFHPRMYAIVFCRTRQETQEVARKLAEDGYGADALHGDLTQHQRDQVMDRFRRRTLTILVATDVAARGLDVNDLTHVINYNLPDDVASYTHRSGRTGRAGRSGISMAIINMKERFKVREIEKAVKKSFNEGRIPTGEEICRQQLLYYGEKVRGARVDERGMEPFLDDMRRSLASLDRDELISRIVALECRRFLDHYRNTPDLQPPRLKTEGKGRFDRKKKQMNSAGFTRFFLNVGKKDGVLPQRLIGEINEVPGIPRIKIGRIEIKKNSAVLEADSRFVPQVLGAFRHLRINGKPVSVEVAEGGRPSPGALRNRKGRKSWKGREKGAWLHNVRSRG